MIIIKFPKSLYWFIIIGILLIVFVTLKGQLNFVSNEIVGYKVEVKRTLTVEEEPEESFSGYVGPFVTITVEKDVVTKSKGSIVCDYTKAIDTIKANITIDFETEVSLTTPKGTQMINTFDHGGNYNAGYIAGLAHYITYRIQEGSVWPVYADQTLGEEKSFVAKEPMNIKLQWKIYKDYNPEVSKPTGNL